MKTTIAILFSIVYTLFCGFAPLGLNAAPVADQPFTKGIANALSYAASLSSDADSEASDGHSHFPVVHVYHKQCNSCGAGLKYLRDTKSLLPHWESGLPLAQCKSGALMLSIAISQPLYISHCAFLI